MEKQYARYRTNLLAHQMNVGKERQIKALLKAWRTVAILHGREQWQIFFKTGGFNIWHNVSRTGYELVGTSYGQMIRRQVIGQLDSFVSSRQNEFREVVSRSKLPDTIKHQLRFINRWKAWFSRGPLMMKDGDEIPEGIRKLARTVMRHVISKHRQPSFKHINMVIDQRCAAVSDARIATNFPIWVRLSTLTKGKPVDIPLRTYEHFESRQGTRSRSIQINTQGGNLRFGIMTDVSESYVASRRGYQPLCEELALDIGLTTLLATDQGDLLGRRWIDRLKWYDTRISRLAAYRQQHKLKARSPKYRKLVGQLRGFITTEVNRIMNRLIDLRRPAKIVIERLDFRYSDLSRRLNRLIRNFGQGIFKKKISDLQERFGIEIEERNPAYTSQECECGYVDKRNRQSQSTFVCKWCGKTSHADVNGARRVKARGRSAALSDPKRHRKDILVDLVRQFNERNTRPKVRPVDPRLSNPYFQGYDCCGDMNRILW